MIPLTLFTTAENGNTEKMSIRMGKFSRGMLPPSFFVSFFFGRFKFPGFGRSVSLLGRSKFVYFALFFLLFFFSKDTRLIIITTKMQWIKGETGLGRRFLGYGWGGCSCMGIMREKE